MAYNIVKSNGSPLVTVNDGQTNSTATSLTLVGKNFAGYGTFLNENFVKLLENFASDTRPQYAQTGQLWYQTSTKLLQVYNGNTWKSISGAQNLADAPDYKVGGDLWYDSVNQQLKVWSGSSWIIIGPSFTSTTGTSGAVADTIISSGDLVSHVVVKFFVQNQLVAVLSKDNAFTPQTTIPGFPTIRPGMNLASGRDPDLIYYQTANNASYLGNKSAASYLTTESAVLTGQLTVQNTDGIEILENDGTVSDFRLNVKNNFVQLLSYVRGNGLRIITKPDNFGGSNSTVLNVDPTTGLITVNNEPTDALGVATKSYVDTRDNTTRNYLKANVDLIQTKLDVITANTTNEYGNVRASQNALGFNVSTSIPISSGIELGISAATAYTRITGSSTFAGNLLTLWANVAAIHANTLSNTGTWAGLVQTGTPSMYSNVASLQSRTASLESSTLRRDGSLTVLGTQTPGTPDSYDLGSTGFRFKEVFTTRANVSTTTGTREIFANVAGATRGRTSLTIYANPLYLTGNVGFVDASDGTSANASIGVISDLNLYGGLNIRGSVTLLPANGGAATTANGAYSIGSVTNGWLDTVYVKNIRAESITAGSVTSSGGSSGGQTFSGDLIPDADGTRNLGNTSGPRRWNVVYAKSFSSDTGVSLGATGIRLNAATPQDIGASGASFGTVYFGQLQGTTVFTSTSGIFLQAAAGSCDIGASGKAFNNVYGTLFSGKAGTAQYADLAERFAADTAYPAGTIVTIGGTAEITQENTELSEDVFGVISTDPAYLMNSGAGTGDTHPPVALNGRVPVRVVGAVAKGAALVAAGNGCARAAAPGERTPYNVIGRALASKTSDGEELIEAIVRTNV